jgi:hypothetical protein
MQTYCSAGTGEFAKNLSPGITAQTSRFSEFIIQGYKDPVIIFFKYQQIPKIWDFFNNIHKPGLDAGVEILNNCEFISLYGDPL